jgi:hypothetical protein
VRRAGPCPRELGGALHAQLTPKRRWRVASSGLEGRRVAVLRLHVVPLSNSYWMTVSYLASARDSEHEGNTRGRIVRQGGSVGEDGATMSYFGEFYFAGRVRDDPSP